jgi:hypothetical protein
LQDQQLLELRLHQGPRLWAALERVNRPEDFPAQRDQRAYSAAEMTRIVRRNREPGRLRALETARVIVVQLGWPRTVTQEKRTIAHKRRRSLH